MANFDFDLGLLEHQLHLARQNAIQTELAAAGLQEVGHPMLMCILRTAGARGADGRTPVSYTHLDVYKRQVLWSG